MTYGDIEGVTAEAIRPKALCHNNPLNPLKPIVTHNYFTFKQLPQVSSNKKGSQPTDGLRPIVRYIIS